MLVMHAGAVLVVFSALLATRQIPAGQALADVANDRGYLQNAYNRKIRIPQPNFRGDDEDDDDDAPPVPSRKLVRTIPVWKPPASNGDDDGEKAGGGGTAGAALAAGRGKQTGSRIEADQFLVGRIPAGAVVVKGFSKVTTQFISECED